MIRIVPKLIDAFTGFNEIEIAEFRINYLGDLVKKVVIAESDLTHSGEKKPLYFHNWLLETPKYRNKVEVIYVDLKNEVDAWSREVKQREELASYLLKNYKGHRFILSDLDEIPSINQVSEFLKSKGSFKYETTVYFRYANFKVENGFNWKRGSMGGSELLRLENGGRFAELPSLLGEEKGLHLSYMGGVKSTSNKLQSFAHQELNFEEFTSAHLISFANKFGIDHLGNYFLRGEGLLRIQSVNEFSDMQKRLFESNPDLFNLSVIDKSNLHRKLASLVITLIRLKPRLRNILFKTFISPQKESSVMESLLSYLAVIIFFLIHQTKKSILRIKETYKLATKDLV